MLRLASVLSKVSPGWVKQAIRLSIRFGLTAPLFQFLRIALLSGAWKPKYLPVEGKEVLVVGSGKISPTWAPSTKPSYVIGVNGSLGNAGVTLRLNCDALVCDASLFNEFDRRTNPSRSIVVEKGWPSGATVQKLITVQSNNFRVDIPPGDSLVYRDYVHLNRITRRAITSFVCGSRVIDDWEHVGLTSSGIFAVALALACGAKKVELVGMSLKYQSGQPTHYYGSVGGLGMLSCVQDGEAESKEMIRNHSAADAHFISGATLAGYAIETSASEFDTLTTLSSWVKARK